MHVTRQYRAYSFGEPIDSCHFGLVHRRELTREECISTGTTISSQLLRSNRLYCNYDDAKGSSVPAVADLSFDVVDFFVYFRGPFYFCLPNEGRSKLRRFPVLCEFLHDQEREDPQLRNVLVKIRTVYSMVKKQVNGKPWEPFSATLGPSMAAGAMYITPR